MVGRPWPLDTGLASEDTRKRSVKKSLFLSECRVTTFWLCCGVQMLFDITLTADNDIDVLTLCVYQGRRQKFGLGGEGGEGY